MVFKLAGSRAEKLAWSRGPLPVVKLVFGVTLNDGVEVIAEPTDRQPATAADITGSAVTKTGDSSRSTKFKRNITRPFDRPTRQDIPDGRRARDGPTRCLGARTPDRLRPPFQPFPIDTRLILHLAWGTNCPF